MTRQRCYQPSMELLLIVIGGILSTAIVFMVIEGVRGRLWDEEDDSGD